MMKLAPEFQSLLNSSEDPSYSMGSKQFPGPGLSSRK